MSKIDLSGQALYCYISKAFQLNKSHFEDRQFIDPNTVLGTYYVFKTLLNYNIPVHETCSTLQGMPQGPLCSKADSKGN